ncbi:EamA family transporter [Ornithinibacillus sp. L9]|uniref:EamA family transporter n=1 Tax=Ornithinibacillus caprae TaxID=2678566 RepID=A0A6N8FJV2_9BACI|nr:EamA family transporter [Ornithinibacillus caprae]
MRKIYIALLLIMMTWGFNVSAIKILVANVDPILLTSVRIFVAGISVLVILAFFKILRLPTKREVIVIILISLFNVVIHHIFISVGLSKTSGVNAGLIAGTTPLFTMVFSIIFLGNRVSKLRLFGFLLGFIGVATTSIAGSGGIASVSVGDILVLLSILAQAYSFILISKLNPELDPRLLTGYMLLFGSGLIFIASLFEGSDFRQLTKLWSWDVGLVFIFSAVVATALGHMLYNFAIRKVGPAESAIFTNFITFSALIGSAIFLGEAILFTHIIGLVLIVLGVLIGTGVVEYWWRKSRKKEREV